FPREIVKALVEQLSAYPLGTLVRLTTGEIGSVVGTNVEFPLRPIVAVESDGGREKREIDLSSSPLVSIIETVESPDVARVSFTSGLSSDRRSKQGPTVSDQFASLLENLDALASAIQGVVESRSIASEARPHSDSWAPGRPTAQDTVDASFEREVVGLFALEAHEWLAQIHSAVKRLGEGVNGPAKSKLYGIMLQGLTNLARPAATVNLPWIEELRLKFLRLFTMSGGRIPERWPRRCPPCSQDSNESVRRSVLRRGGRTNLRKHSKQWKFLRSGRNLP